MMVESQLEEKLKLEGGGGVGGGGGGYRDAGGVVANGEDLLVERVCEGGEGAIGENGIWSKGWWRTNLRAAEIRHRRSWYWQTWAEKKRASAAFTCEIGVGEVAA